MLGPPESALRVGSTSRTARPLLASRVFLFDGCSRSRALPGVAVIESSAVRSFRVYDASPRQFVRSVDSALGEWGLQGHTELRLEGEIMVFRVRWMGTSELCFRLSVSDGGFVAEPAGERVAPFHAPFRQAFEDRFDEILQRVGARPMTT